MIVYRHVTTFGVTEQRWLSNLTDLEIVEADGRLLLVAANQVRGGISTYAISDPAAPITMLRTPPIWPTSPIRDRRRSPRSTWVATR
ncbi:hypothetical protein [Paracoccus marcusii]|uniref:hypothetical protein n=1 Tax=Paracoccus marcusii TaxID=59779 RepID=UPI003267445E